MRPSAFRIDDFKSIEDSGTCHLSGDGITVLAGQNEAGKTAVLMALRDFDLEEKAAPLTQDHKPEERAQILIREFLLNSITSTLIIYFPNFCCPVAPFFYSNRNTN